MQAAIDDWPDGLDVSRETFERLRSFLLMVERWNPRINLVSRTTLVEGWNRHVVDSAQLWLRVDPSVRTWLDIGSGGGFPGMVVAIVAQELAPRMQMTLVEADQRKCVFLREAARQLGIPVSVRNQRIEMLEPMGVDVLSARALSSLVDLLGYAHRHLGKAGVALFLKGKTTQEEVEMARQAWSFEVECYQSVTRADGVILKVWGVDHA